MCDHRETYTITLVRCGYVAECKCGHKIFVQDSPVLTTKYIFDDPDNKVVKQFTPAILLL